MPSNQKTFDKLSPHEYTALRSHLRVLGWAPPSSDSGLLQGGGASKTGGRGSKGGGSGLLLADMSYDPTQEQLSIRLRSVPSGETYDSVFGKIENAVRVVSATST